jgi:hypothetical protein
MYVAESVHANWFSPSKWIVMDKLVHGACMWSESVQGRWFSSNKWIMLGNVCYGGKFMWTASVQAGWFSLSNWNMLRQVGAGSCMWLKQWRQMDSVPVSEFILTGWFRVHVSALDQCRQLDRAHYAGTRWFRLHVCGWISACQLIQFQQVYYDGQASSGCMYVKWISSG